MVGRTGFARVLAAVATTLALSACTQAASPTGLATATIAPTTGPSSAPTRSLAPAPSGPTPAPATPRTQETVAVGTDERVVDLFVPAVPTRTKAPLIVLLHANGETPFVMAGKAGVGALAARETVIVALPRQRNETWDALLCCDDPSALSPDVKYVRGLIDHLVDRLPVDPDRVFVAGYSMGGVLSDRVACQIADRVVAVAIDAGTPWSELCRPASPVSVLIMHGTADMTFRIGPVTAMAARWRAVLDCPGEPVVTQLSASVESSESENCTSGTAVKYVRYHGAGHIWFKDPDATDLAWSFFLAHPKP